MSLACPKCKGPTKVYDTRKAGAHGIWRRRKCKTCDNKFTTVEKPVNHE